MEFLQQYGIIVLIAICVIGYFAYIYKTKGEELFEVELRHAILQAILQAEKKFGVDSDGTIKADCVVDRLYNIIPVQFKLFLTEEDLQGLVKEVYDNAKDWLDDKKFNDSI